MTLSLIKGSKDELLQKARELMFKSICLGDQEATKQLHELDRELGKSASLKVVSDASESSMTLTRRESLRLLEMIEDPPTRNAKFIQAMNRYLAMKNKHEQ